MSDDLAGGVVAPAAPPVAVVAPASEAPPAALGSQVPEKPQEVVKPVADKVPTTREALRKAMDESKAKNADPAPVAKPEVKDAPQAKVETAERPREQGRFVKADQSPAPAQVQQQPTLTPEQQRAAAESPHREPPARFSPDAKAAWEATSEPVRAEVHRAIRELEQGHQKYKADAEAYHETREYDEMAKQSGTTLKKALFNYTSMENMLRKDPIAGLEMVMKHIGMKTPEGRVINLRDVAEHIMSQSPEESERRLSNQAVQSEMTELRQQVSTLTQHLQNQQTQTVHSEIDAFAEQHPRFDELAQDIEIFLRSKRASSLSEAYQMAERLNPAPSGASTQQPVIPAAPTARQPLNPAGGKSISGAPTSGSDPVPGAASSSTREALKRAMARAG